MAAVYFVFMMAGALGSHSAFGWKPAGWTPPAARAGSGMITDKHVHEQGMGHSAVLADLGSAVLM
jgi:hypothetical protein